MILGLVVASAVAAQAPPPAAPDPSILRDASQAIEAGRLEEGKRIIAKAITEGFRGAPVERLTADLDFASGKYLEAFVAYKDLTASAGKRADDCEKGAISALKIGKVADAKPLVECAVASPSASWRAWNARGVFADFIGDWTMADDSYTRAHELAPTNASVINNQGWSKLLRGEWALALPYFEQASALDGKSKRIADNLELAREAVAADLPKKAPGETDAEWAARLNDAGVAASLLGDKKRAIAAFTQALDASPVWYDRASNNLKALSQN